MINTREIAAEYRLANWAGIMQERSTSGMSISAYCETNGIHKNVYFYWQRKLREKACEKLLPEKQTQQQNPSPPAGMVGSSACSPMPLGWAICKAAGPEEKNVGSVSVEIGKFKLTVNQGDDMELFTKVCQALMPLC